MLRGRTDGEIDKQLQQHLESFAVTLGCKQLDSVHQKGVQVDRVAPNCLELHPCQCLLHFPLGHVFDIVQKSGALLLVVGCVRL